MQGSTLQRIRLLLGAAAVATAGGATAQQPGGVKIIAGYAAGGGGDITARALAEALQAKLGTTVIVENKPGAGGAIAARALKGAPADGSTYLLASDQVFIAPVTLKAAGFDPHKDFTIVAGVNSYDLCLGVSTGAMAATTLAEYLATAAKDAKLSTYGVPAAGSMPQFYGFVIARQAKVALTAVPYRGAAPMVTDLTAGHLPAAIGPCRDMAEQRKAGKVRLLASVQRLAWAPEVPTFAESGYKMMTPNWLALFAPAGLPAAKQQQMQTALQELLQEPAFRDRMAATGFTPRFVPGKDMTQQAHADANFWSAQIRESGFAPE